MRGDEPRLGLVPEPVDADLPSRRPEAGQHVHAGVAGEAAEPPAVERRGDPPDRPRRGAQQGVDPDRPVEDDGEVVLGHPDGADDVGLELEHVGDAPVLAVVPDHDPAPPAAALARGGGGDEHEDLAAEHHLHAHHGVPVAGAVRQHAA